MSKRRHKLKQSNSRARSASWGSIPVRIDGLNFWDRFFVGLTLTGIIIFAFPYLAYAHTVQEQPLVFEVNNPSYLQQVVLSGLVTPQDFPLAEFKPEFVQHPLTPLLKEYLQSKNSPLAEYSSHLLHQYHYRLIIGIAFAESNFCKVQIRPHNCWGIGGGRPESYESLAHGIVRANQLIQKYQDLSMTTPKLMRNSWVGWPNDNWIIAVNQITTELEEMGL